MSLIIRQCRQGVVFNTNLLWRSNSTLETLKKGDDEEEFRVLDILKKKDKHQRRVARSVTVPADRAEKMPTDQNWGNVWPGPRSFHPASVPLPVRQGYVPKGQVQPGKKANAELMKIPNFLHLTPPVIKMQCEAIKQYCTEWPKLLNSEEAVEKHYPVEVITSDYCHASPTIRNPLARVVTLRIKLSSLQLDKHAKDKFLRLVGERYNKETDLITFTADRCPMRKQNLDYVHYLLTATYHESWTFEDWEKNKTEEDMEYYIWDNNKSKKNLTDWHLRVNNEVKLLTEEEYKNFDVSGIAHSEEYKQAVTDIYNVGENKETLHNYDRAVRKLLGLPERKCN